MYILELFRNGERVYDGAYSLAAQVYAQQNIFLDEPILFPYYNDPVLQIGRFQNTIEEVNMDYVEDQGIDIVRRDTGGGTIYIDRLSANICFLIDEDTSDIFGAYDKMYQPVIKALKEMGLENVEQKGRNDLVLDGKKISGAAMTLVNGRIYGGFSLLLNVDYETIVKALNPNEKKIISKGIKSVKSRVNEIRPHLSPEYRDLEPEEFMYRVIEKAFDLDSIDQLKRYELSDADWEEIDKLVEEKYKNWDWNFGKSPRYAINKDERTSAGTIDISLSVNGGLIDQIKIYGDYFAKADTADVEQALIGVKHRREDVSQALSSLNLDDYFKNIQDKELIDLIVN